MSKTNIHKFWYVQTYEHKKNSKIKLGKYQVHTELYVQSVC